MSDNTAQLAGSGRFRNASSEEAYAGPNLAMASLTPPGSPEPATTQRIKRLKGRSDEHDLSSDLPLVKEDYRCAGPVYVSLPRRSTLQTQNTHQQIDALNLHAQVTQILRQHGLQEKDWYPHRFYNLEQAADVFWIKVENGKISRQWIKACESVIALFRRNGLSTLNVEMVNEAGLMYPTSSPISPLEPLVQHWQQVKNLILGALMPNRTWKSIDVLNRSLTLGYWTKVKMAAVPTIVIRIDHDSEENWGGPRDRIDKILQDSSKSKHFAVEFIRAYETPFTLEPPTQQQHHKYGRLWQELGYVGASIGVANDATGGTGTCGCFLRLRQKKSDGTNADQICALTNFHVVMPGSSSVNPSPIASVPRAIMHGLPSNSKDGQAILIDMPSKTDDAEATSIVESQILRVKARTFAGKTYDEVLEWVNEGIQLKDVMTGLDRENFADARNFVSDLQSQLSAAAARFATDESSRLGHVFAGSGLRRRKDALMDWALISVKKSRAPGTNKLHDADLPASKTLARHSAPKPGQLVHKLGRSTGNSSGDINCIQRTTQLRGWKVGTGGAQEYEIGSVWIIVKDNFAAPGDSGSAIFDDNGELKGLFVGGDRSDQPGVADVSYFISVIDLFADIKEMTRADEIDVLSPVDFSTSQAA